MKSGLALLIVFCAAPAAAVAQGCTASGSPSRCTISASVSLTATSLVWAQISSTTTSLTNPTPADFTAGVNSSTGPTLTVASNGPWSVQIRANSAVWSASGPLARANKPAGDLKWSATANGAFSALSTTDSRLASGPPSGENVVTIFFQTLYDWRVDTPGTYSLGIVLTLTTP
jgi:hypothetical protein